MLAHYLVQLNDTGFEFSGKQVLELGSGDLLNGLLLRPGPHFNKLHGRAATGTGVVGLTAALLGAKVTLTDQAHLLDIISTNIEVLPCGSSERKHDADQHPYESIRLSSPYLTGRFQSGWGLLLRRLPTCMSIAWSSIKPA